MATTPIAANNLLSLVNPINKSMQSTDMLLGSSALDFKLNVAKAPEDSFNRVFEQEAKSVRPEPKVKRERATPYVDDIKDKPLQQDKPMRADSSDAVKPERQKNAKEGKALPNEQETAAKSVTSNAKPTQASNVNTTNTNPQNGLLAVSDSDTVNASQQNDNTVLSTTLSPQVTIDNEGKVETEILVDDIDVDDSANAMPHYLVSNDVTKQVRQAVMATQPQVMPGANNTVVANTLMADNENLPAQTNHHSLLANNVKLFSTSTEEGIDVEGVELELKSETNKVKLELAGTKTNQQPINTNNFAALLQKNTNLMANMTDKLAQSNVSASAVSSVAKVAATSASAGVETSAAALKAADTSLKAAKAMPTLTASVPVTHKNWGEAVMQNVMYMSSKNMKQAEINLDPPELGALQVRINTQGDQTTVQFVSQNMAARDALEQNINRLREMMEEQGMELIEADINDGRDQQMAQEQSDESEEGSQAAPINGQQDDEEMVSVSEAKLEEIGLVDSYA